MGGGIPLSDLVHRVVFDGFPQHIRKKCLNLNLMNLLLQCLRHYHERERSSLLNITQTFRFFLVLRRNKVITDSKSLSQSKKT